MPMYVIGTVGVSAWGGTGPCGRRLAAVREKAIQSLRLRLCSGLRQQGGVFGAAGYGLTEVRPLMEGGGRSREVKLLGARSGSGFSEVVYGQVGNPPLPVVGWGGNCARERRAVRFANAHLIDDETVAKMGHPGDLAAAKRWALVILPLRKDRRPW
jgi:hypothetical protein